MSGTEDAAESRDDELVGRAIGKYTLGRVIGRGGMGIVYEALNTAIGKRVAIKLVSAELAKNKDAVKRFQREAQAASAVESAHIVDIFDAGVTDDGTPYIVMELLRGEDLGHRIKRLGRLELGDALHVTVQILRGLSRAHAAGIIHRDLKPDNVFLVDRDDDPTFVKVLDFGISKVARQGDTPVQTLTKQGTVLGTPFYMSPEQAQGLPDTDGRADLWSVGAILYECLTGRAPHTGASYEQVIVNICAKDAADVRTHNPGVPEPVARVLVKALARDRDERFASARDFMEGLVGASGGTLTLPPRSSDEPSAPDGSGRFAAMSPSGAGLRVGSGSGAKSGSGARSGSGSGVESGRGSGAGASTQAFDDTIELMKGGGPSRVGWATSGGPTVGRERKRLVIVGVAAAALGVLVMLVIGLRKPGASAASGERPADGAGTGASSSEITVKLRANVKGARFMVDGKQISGGLLRGPRGETKKVVALAEGYTPVETLVALEADREPPELVLLPLDASATGPTGSQGPVAAQGAGQSAGQGAGQSAGQGAGQSGQTGDHDPGVPRNGVRVNGSGSAGVAGAGTGGAKPGATGSAKASAAPSQLPAATATAVTPPPTPTLTIKLD